MMRPHSHSFVRRAACAAASALLLSASVLAAGAVRSTEWPQFRGPSSDGVAIASGLFEQPVGIGLEVGWKQAIGSGYSAISVAGGRVVTMFSDGDADFVAAFDVRTGQELWRRKADAKYAGHDGSHDGPLSTPLILDGRVIGVSPRGSLFAVKAEDGSPEWEVDLVETHGAAAPFYGFGVSPVAAEGIVVLQVGGEFAIAGFDPATGEKLWGVGADGAQYQTPAVVHQEDGSTVVVASGQSQLMAIAPRTGEILWSHAHEGNGPYGVSSATPVPAGDGRIFLAHKDDASEMFAVTRDGDSYKIEKLWENNAIRHSYNTPVYHDGHLYGFSSRFLLCVNAETGEPVWRSREPGDGFLMLVDGHLVVVTKDGGLHIVKATPDGYSEAAGLTLFQDHAWSAPSFANGHIFARSLGELARIDVGSGATFAEANAAAGAEAKGTKFGKFLNKLARATPSDRKGMVDAFMASNKSFPVVEKDKVTFIYRGNAHDVAVAGDMIGVALEASMGRVEGTDLFHYTMTVESDARLNYKLIADYEEILDPLNPRSATTSVVGKDMELNFGPGNYEMSWFSMPDWRAPEFLADPKGPRGNLETIEFESEGVGGKVTAEVYLPAGYSAGDRRYPVVYVFGGTDAVARGQWPTALDNLIGQSIDPLIAVFIGPVQAQFPQLVQMFATDLIPHVDGAYRTVAGADGRAVVGQGFGAVGALFAAVGQPGLVGKVATQSAFVFEFAWDPLMPMVKSAEENPLQIYMDWGKYDLRSYYENWDLANLNRRVANYLDEKGYQVAGGEIHDGSGWPSWRNRTDALLEALFPLGKAGT